LTVAAHGFAPGRGDGGLGTKPELAMEPGHGVGIVEDEFLVERRERFEAVPEQAFGEEASFLSADAHGGEGLGGFGLQLGFAQK